MSANLDLPCPHEHFVAIVDVGRIVDPGQAIPKAYVASIKVECAQCSEPFRWTGVQAGASFDRPMCSPDETELRAPLRPASADPDFGLGLPGFAINFRPGGPDPG